MPLPSGHGGFGPSSVPLSSLSEPTSYAGASCMRPMQQLAGTEGSMNHHLHHGSNNSDMERLYSSFSRPGPHAAPLATVTEEDLSLMNAVGGLELVAEQEPDLAECAAAAARGTAQLSDHTGPPSRVLVVRHVPHDTPVEELQQIFKAFGDVQGLHTACKMLGVVVAAYFDLRSAVTAQGTLQGTLIGQNAIDVRFAAVTHSATGQPVNQGQVVVFNLDPDTSNEQLVWLFSKFGDVEGIAQSPSRQSQKFIRFYDVRHAASAMRAMGRAEQLGKIPPHMTPQQMATLQTVTSGPSLMHLAQLAGSQVAGGVGWDSLASSPATMGSLLQLVSHHQQQQGLGGNDLASHPSGTGLALHTSGGAAGLPSHASGGMDAGVAAAAAVAFNCLRLDPALEAVRGNHPGGLSLSDSASSIASTVPGGLLLATGQHANGSAAATAATKANPHNPSVAATAAASIYQQQLSMMQQAAQAAKAANLLMGLNLNQGLDGKGPATMGGAWNSAGAAAAAPDVAAAALAAASISGMGMGPDAAAAAAATAALLNTSGAGNPSVTALGGHNPALAALQEMQVRQQLQATAVLSGASAQAPVSAASANLQTAAQILQAAGLNQFGQLPVAAGVHPYLPGLAAAANPYAAAAAQVLQQAGLGVAGLPPGVLGPFHPHHVHHHQHGSGGGGSGGGLYGGSGSGGGGGPYGGSGGGGGGGPYGSSGSGGSGGPYGGSGGGGSGGGNGPYGGGMGGGGRGMLGGDGGGMMGGRNGGRLSRRSTDPVAEAERKAQQEKLYALNLDKIARGEDRRTTLMIKNIPNKYTQKMLLGTVDELFKGTYDFFYLPIDFKNKCNVGYAFINMVQPMHIVPLVQRFNNKKWERFNSEKVCSISYARIQGRAALVQHFQNSSLMHEDKRCRPILFTLEDSGEVAGEQEPFPAPTTGSSLPSHHGSMVGGGGSSSMLAGLGAPGSGGMLHSSGGSGTRLSGLAGSSTSLRSAGGSTSSLRGLDATRQQHHHHAPPPLPPPPPPHLTLLQH